MTPSELKEVGQIATWFAAAGFFFYKCFTGYFIGSSSLRLSCARAPVPDRREVEHLSIVAVLKRGSGSTLRLHDAKARVTYAENYALPDTRKRPRANHLPAAIDTESNLIGIARLSSSTEAKILQGQLSPAGRRSTDLELGAR